MSDLSPTIKPSPNPSLVVLQESTSASSDGEIEVIDVKGPSLAGLNKRKSGSERDTLSGREGMGPITKRPRHSISGVRRSSVSGFRISALGSGTDSTSRPGKSVKKAIPSPTRQTTLRFLPISSNRPNEQSTASALAALYNPPPGVDPKWRQKSKSSLNLKPRDSQLLKRRRVTDVPEVAFLRGKGKGKANLSVSPDSSDDPGAVDVSSSTGPIRDSGAKGTKNTMRTMASSNASSSGIASGPKRPSLIGQALVKSTRERDEHGPLYVNDRRQFARKTTTSSKPAKVHQFNRQLTTGKDNSGTGSSSSVSSSGSARSPTNEGNSTGDGHEMAPQTITTARTSIARQEPSRSLTSTIKGKEKAMSLPKHLRNSDVIVIESSDDESSMKTAGPAGLSQLSNNSSRRTFLSKVKLPIKPKEGQKRHTIGGPMDLPTALNEMYEQQGNKQEASSSHKQLEQDIIDLTLDDSDDVRVQSTETQQKLNEVLPSSEAKQEMVLAIQAQSTERAIVQAQISSPITRSIIALTPTTGSLHPKMAGDLLTRPSKLQSTPRPRSVPMTSIPDVSTAPRQSQSARTSPTSSSGRAVRERHVLPTRRIIRSPESDDSEAADEQEVIEVVVDDMVNDMAASASEGRINLKDDLTIPSVPASSSNGSSTRASPELILPLRRSTRHSSASSNDHVPLTDAESPPASSPSPEPADTIKPPSYGGFKALTWDLHKRNLNNFHFKHYSAKDIPTSLPDSINRLSAYTRRDAGIRDVFQAFILENICDDEASAPEIEIINEIDAEPSPVFEFNYSNRMWYGEGVVMPDYSKLKGCECIGRCDPKSETCACAIKTRSYLEIDGCVYEKNGRLKHPRYPIFECNDLCSCDDDCRNRVVQHGRKVQLNIRKTQSKGWGVFNGPKRTPKGTFLGIYAGELLTDEQGEVRGRYYNTLGKSYLFDIDFWHLKKGHDPDEWHNKYTVDAYHAGNFTRFLNHSCEPNARLFPCYINEPDIEKPLLVVFSNKDIAPYEEICFNYMGSYSEDEGDDDDDDEYENEEESHGEKRKDAVYRPCMCGARKCKGVMWN